LIIIDRETDLEIGDPDIVPFRVIDMDKLQKNIEKRIKYGVASASGIRQIFDQTYGDDPTNFMNGTGASITDAAKIHVATITDCFINLLKKSPTVVVGIDSRHTGPAIADIVIRVAVWHGVAVRYTFISPITEIAVYSREVSDGFIYISASHNPKSYNGLKMGFDDGRLLPGKVARAFIEEYQSRLVNIDNTREMIKKANEADPNKIRDIYGKIDDYRKESREIYSVFADTLITGMKDPQNARERKNALKKDILKRDLWIGIDTNGGARKDREYLESWGFNVYEINSRPRVDMVHDLSPVPEACGQAKNAMIDLQKNGKNIVAFFVYDTDGDRKNIIIPDGKGGAAIPGVQMIFALDILCSILDMKLQDSHQKIGIVVNDATSSIVEQLAYHLDFMVKRVEVGEANVASAGQSLYESGIDVPIMGEGSNGSVLNLDLLVREPLHTIRTIISFITKPEMTEYLLDSLHRSKHKIVHNIDIGNWYSPDKIKVLFMNIINALPPSRTTDFFTDDGIRKSVYDIPQKLFKDNFDEYFKSSIWHEISEKIENTYDGKPIAEFVNCEGESELRGCGNRSTGTGGYKIEFYVQKSDDKRHVGWIWFRASATEIGILRKGVSVSHWEMSPEASKAVDSMYTYMDNMLTEALNAVEERIVRRNDYEK